MKFMYFFYTNLGFFESAHFKNIPAHDEKNLERTLLTNASKESCKVCQIDHYYSNNFMLKLLFPHFATGTRLEINYYK